MGKNQLKSILDKNLQKLVFRKGDAKKIWIK